MIPVRICILLLIFAFWFWANSIFTPWARSTDPRLWLYDALFYTRFLLLFWASFELLYAWQQIRNMPSERKSAVTSISAIGIAALAVSAYLYLMHSGIGFRTRVEISSEALNALKKPALADVRQRAGWFLIDTQRQPCGDQPWLWLGNTYGGGTGNNLALVYSENNRVPETPVNDAFRFWPVSEGWWLAYQNPRIYYTQLAEAKTCTVGMRVDSHEQGIKFIDE